MAVTAVVTVSPTAVEDESRAVVTCTISNSGTSDVTVTAVEPYVVVESTTAQNVPAAFGRFLTGTAIVPASGSLALKAGLILHGSPIASDEMWEDYTVGATVYLTDRTEVTATTAVLEDSSGPANPAYAGRLWFDDMERSGMVATILY
jgi:hypothetical protein